MCLDFGEKDGMTGASKSVKAKSLFLCKAQAKGTTSNIRRYGQHLHGKGTASVGAFTVL